MPTIVVGVAGGSGSGKTTVSEQLVRRLGGDNAAVLAHDRYYRDLTTIAPDLRSGFNFDHPEALETDLLIEHLRLLRGGRTINAPVYDFTRHVRDARLERFAPRPVIVVEGVLILVDRRLRDLMDLKVFVYTDDETRFARRLHRDVAERGRTVESVQAQYAATVQPMHDRFVEPSRCHADLVITEGGFNVDGIDKVAAEIDRLRGSRN